jgi:hypothetical protein
MNGHQVIVIDPKHQLEDFAAELTEAAYPIALRHGVGEKWLDLELDLWKVLIKTVNKWDQQTHVPGSAGK